ncbi:mechanosensitive ion channel [Cytophagaceae bacterium ABcell3]|nr:mechanosensitive ion channel [Cytophagaceae bacterium ABcell3]
MDTNFFDTDEWVRTGISMGELVLVVLLGWGVSFVMLKIAYFLLQRRSDFMASSLKKRVFLPIYLLLILFFINLAYPLIQFPQLLHQYLQKGLEIGWIVIFSWIIIKLSYVLEDFIYVKYTIDIEDNMSRRRIRTQFQFIKKIFITIVCIIALSLILMTFERVREIGTSLLASAGVAGVIIGFAAQRTIANILAGFQIAFTQPIRIDDVVIVENEWGRIEEINLTYVVVKIWDLRRLVLPITYFIEKPFQNWTRNHSDILGSVFLYVDYSIPLEPLRQELKRVLDSSPLWDKKVWVLQVTNTTEKTMELRALMSAKDAPRAWDLRCYVREQLITFVQQNYPDSLPKVRAELQEKENSTNDEVPPRMV